MAELDLKAIGGRIRGRRSQLKLSQVALAKLCGVGRRTIVNIERGSYPMTIETLAVIARHLTLDVRYILYGNDFGVIPYPQEVRRETPG